MKKTHRICCAGFGGQGVMLMGQLLAYAGLLEEQNVTWCPSYGPEMRGGTANCSIIVSENPVTIPFVASEATSVVVFNQASFDKFVPLIAKNGSVYINSSLVHEKIEREDIKAYYIPANDIAAELGNPKLLNIIMLGALIEKEGIVSKEAVLEAFKKVFGASKEKYIPVNKLALEIGSQVVRVV